MTNEELANNKLIRSFSLAKEGSINEEEFNRRYYSIRDWAEKNGVKCSKEKRMDGKEKDGGRSPFVYFNNIYDRTKKENYEFEEYFIGTFKRKGYDLVWGNEDDGLGLPKLKADDKPDKFIMSKDRKRLIDAKNLYGRGVLYFKWNNICSYEKYYSAIFVTTSDRCFYLSASYVKYLKDNFYPKKCLKFNKKGYVLGGKPCIEISDREEAQVKMEDFLKDERIEEWKKNDIDPQWTRALKRYNKKGEKC